MSGRVLVVDDSPVALAVLEDHLSSWGLEVVAADRGARALAALDTGPFDVVITDLRMPDIDGTAVLAAVRARDPGTPVIMVSATIETKAVLRAVRDGAFDYVLKNEDPLALRASIERALQHVRLLRENRRLLAERDEVNATLEARVAQRTHELQEVNRRLELERAELQRALDTLHATQAQLVQAEKLGSIGLLTAGVAHEINNPLAFLLPNFVHLQQRLGLAGILPHDAETGDLLEECREGLERIRRIVRELGVFSRRGDAQPQAVELRPLVDSLLRFVGPGIRQRATLEAEVPEPLVVSGNADHLRQILLNLVINASQALVPGRPDGRIRILARREGDAVRITIEDNGRGISPDAMGRIFDPFFTTKPVGQGTGLGLTVGRQLVQGMGGDISVQSRHGEGTTVVVSVPAWHDASLPVPVTPAAATRSTQRLRVAVIDDEPALLAALERLLGRRHRVVRFTTAREALAWLEDHDVDAVLCDLMMPGMTGVEFHRELERTRPTLARRVVFMTGATLSAEVRAFAEWAPGPLLEKPFDESQLAERLAALAAPAGEDDRHGRDRPAA